MPKGLYVDLISFPDQPPRLETLAERVAARGGLSVQAEPLGLEDGRYLVHGRLYFACLPKVIAEIACDSPGWKRQTKRREIAALVAGGEISPRHLHALEESLPPGCQVWVDSFGSVDPTLFWYTVLALEDLGGTLSGMDKPLSDRARLHYEDVRRKYSEPVTEEELRRRVRAAAWATFWHGCLLIALLPVMVPIWILSAVWALWEIPERLRAAKQRQQRGKYRQSSS